jgi:hypothetical protein
VEKVEPIPKYPLKLCFSFLAGALVQGVQWFFITVFGWYNSFMAKQLGF